MWCEAAGSRDSGTCRFAMSTTAKATGPLIRKIQRHEATPMSQPPMKGPAAPAIPPSPDQAPMARARSPGRNDACRIARLPGVNSAPPTPCNAREAISIPTFSASPQSIEASANHSTPATNRRRLPKRSPRDPPSRMRQASVSVYALTVQVSPERPASRSLPIVGSAMLTTVASTNVRLEPRTVAASTQRPADSP